MDAPGETTVRPAHRGPKIAGITAAAVVLACLALYLIGYLLTGDRLPRNASVAGIAVGGQTRQDAIETLRGELGDRAADPIELTVDGTADTIDPAEAGVTIDYAATVDRLGIGRSLDPRRIWAGLTGGRAIEPVIATDDARLAAAVDDLAGRHDRKPKNAAVRITTPTKDPQIDSSRMTTGLTVDRAAAARVIPRGLLADRPVTVPASEDEPAITDAEVQKLIKDKLQPALSAPVTITADGHRAEITATMIAPALTISTSDGTPTATLDPQRLHRRAADALDDLETRPAKDADIELRDGKPVVVPGKPGTAVAAADLADAVSAAMIKSGDQRTAAVKITTSEPEFSTADAEKLGVKEVTGEFTTHYPYAEYRNVNIGRAAELINGTLLKPGEVFSLNRVVGERTRENGFTEGSIISGGQFKEELGGGVSQSATTTFNAMFFAGLEDVEHQPHTLYIDRYPAGREATVAWPTLDLKFRNNTQYGVLVQAELDPAEPGGQGSLTVRMWSTRSYDKIVATDPVNSDFTDGRDITDDSPSCVPTSPVQGFHVTYSRLFYRDGRVVKSEDFAWTYDPTDRRICV